MQGIQEENEEAASDSRNSAQAQPTSADTSSLAKQDVIGDRDFYQQRKYLTNSSRKTKAFVGTARREGVGVEYQQSVLLQLLAEKSTAQHYTDSAPYYYATIISIGRNKQQRIKWVSVKWGQGCPFENDEEK